MFDYKIYFGPQTMNILDAILEYDNNFPERIGIIISRNQIENEKYGKSYLFNNKIKFIKYVKQSNKKIQICRDHGGIFQNNSEKYTSYKEAYKNSLDSLIEDAGLLFDIIHLDPENFKKRYEESNHFLTNLIQTNKKILLEFGEEKKMLNLNKKKYLDDLRFFSKFEKNKKYILSYTKSFINNGKNYIKFNMNDYKFIINETKKFKLKIKDHNCDFLSKKNLKKKKSLGIKNFNIAPELSFIENDYLLKTCKKYKLVNEFNLFANYVLKNNKWKKWTKNSSNKDLKFKLSAHYHYKTKYYENIIKKINKNFNYNYFVIKKLKNIINQKFK